MEEKTVALTEEEINLLSLHLWKTPFGPPKDKMLAASVQVKLSKAVES